MKSSFSLAPGERPLESLGRDGYRSGRHFVDFVIDGTPLQTIMLRSRRSPWAEDLVPVLVADWPIDQDLDTLLGKSRSDLPGGRVPLFVCPECGDLGCGAVTAILDWEVDSVTWRDFVFQNNYEPIEEEARFDDIGPFAFDRVHYEATLEDCRVGWAARAAERHVVAKREQIVKKWSLSRLFSRPR